MYISHTRRFNLSSNPRPLVGRAYRCISVNTNISICTYIKFIRLWLYILYITHQAIQQKQQSSTPRRESVSLYICRYKYIRVFWHKIYLCVIIYMYLIHQAIQQKQQSSTSHRESVLQPATNTSIFHLQRHGIPMAIFSPQATRYVLSSCTYTYT